jgi:hypothetical protein
MLSGDRVQPETDDAWTRNEREQHPVETTGGFGVFVAAAHWADRGVEIDTEVWLDAAPDEPLGESIWTGTLTTRKGNVEVGDPAGVTSEVYVGGERYRLDVHTNAAAQGLPPLEATRVQFALFSAVRENGV